MGTVVLSIVLCLMLPVLLLCVYLDRKPRRIMTAFLVGILSCLLAFFINSALMKIVPGSSKYYSTTVSPIVEELLKFAPLLLLSIIWKEGKHGTASMSFAIGVGFCVVENFYYLVNDISGLSLVWVVSRCIGTGLMHSMSATVIGLGIFYSRLERRMTPQCITASLFFSIMYHGLYNLLVQDMRFQLIGISLPLLTYLLVFVFLNKNELSKLLPDEK